MQGNYSLPHPEIARLYEGKLMNKGQLIDAIANENELSKAEAGRVLDSVISQIQNTLAK